MLSNLIKAQLCVCAVEVRESGDVEVVGIAVVLHLNGALPGSLHV